MRCAKKKICTMCKEVLSLDLFYGGIKNAPDGKRAECKSCNDERTREYGTTKRGKIVRLSARRKYKITYRGKLAAKRYQQNNALRHREKTNARARVNYEINTQKIQRQPCEKCGSNEKVHAHHTDYSKPLDVRWLCQLHHNKLHHALPN